MPELPEVEVSRQGLLPYLSEQCIVGAVVRTPRLRHEIPAGLDARLAGCGLTPSCAAANICCWTVKAPAAAAGCSSTSACRAVCAWCRRIRPPQKHDHVDLLFKHTVLRFRDSRRFGALLWHEGIGVESHPALADLGIEPLSEASRRLALRGGTPAPHADQAAADGQPPGGGHRQHLCRRKPPPRRHFAAARADRISLRRYRCWPMPSVRPSRHQSLPVAAVCVTTCIATGARLLPAFLRGLWPRR
jgi:hypothetical protein